MADTPDIPSSPDNGAPDNGPPHSGAQPGAGYQVLARKYRPQDFSSLIGQDAMVRTLSNAFKLGRVAHAFILTGVRGVGKTTTARIIAKALNCTGHDGDGPTIEPCGKCDNCVAITDGRSVDVMEMDAASRTGIDDIREIIEGVRYGPVQGRYKVYIIDEVHMLSKAAFNGLLKTLEEPPPHVKFVFATTEIRKVPVTVLSRCQRFDLKRVSASEIIALMERVAGEEKAGISAGALALIARAAEGSVRDALSLLDQAIAHGSDTGVDETLVQAMLGLADRGLIFELFETLMRGQAGPALDQFAALFEAGADALTVLNDLLEVTHAVTRAKVLPEQSHDLAIPENERIRARELADGLSMAVLGRAWQMLLKGADEVARAARPLPAAEMVMIRLTHAADLPHPGDLVKRLDGAPQGQSPAENKRHSPGSNGPPPRSPAGRGSMTLAAANPNVQAAPEPEPLDRPQAASVLRLERFEDLVALADDKRDILLKTRLETLVHPVKFSPGRLEIRLDPKASPSFPGELQKRLKEWTGTHWTVTLSNEEGAPTLDQQRQAAQARSREELASHPMVQAVQKVFPGAELVGIREMKLTPPDLNDDLKGEK